MSILNYSALELNKLLQKQILSVQELITALEAHIMATEPSVKAFVYLDLAKAKTASVCLDERIRRGEEISCLAGVPFVLKANMATINEPTHACSEILREFKPGYNAAVAAKLTEADAILLGKTNMDALAMGSSTVTSCFGPSYNPWAENLSPGGSSGGSAAAVAAKEAWFALGSDTGGSIRQPAAFCGLVGMKPTFGLVPAFGVVPLAPTLDQVGPITRNVRDCAAVMSLISKKDLGFMQEVPLSVKGLKIAVAKEYMELALPEMSDAVYKALAVYEKEGAVITEISLPLTKYALPAYHVIAPTDFAALLSGDDYKNCPGFVEAVKAYDSSLFGIEEQRRILMGHYFNSFMDHNKHYIHACKIRRLLQDELNSALEKYACIVTPTTCNTAFSYSKMPKEGKEMYKNDMLLAAASIAGLPAVSLPCGIINGLPAAMQIMGRPYNDRFILDIAEAYEVATAKEYILY
jgi:aspartyl-tRNA(Asn)/glutamyl-tRNA(Gln) amidotransferase subunit A